jgi:outer membrane protein TolC
MNGKYKYLLLILLMASVNVSAQTVRLRSVTDAIEYAMKNNPDLEIYKQNQKKAQYDYNSLKNYRLPGLSASFSGVDNLELPVTKIPGEIFGQPGTTLETTFGQRYNYNYGITLSQNILDFQSKFNSKVAKVNLEIAEANQEVYKQKMAEQVAFYYYTAIISSKALTVNEENLKTAEELFTITEQKFSEGIVDKRSVNLALMNKNNIVQNINSYKIIIEQCYSNLKIFFGFDYEEEIILTENIEAYKTDISSIELIGQDKSLELFKLQLEQSGYVVNQQRASLFPKLSINAYFGAQQYRDDYEMSFKNNDWSEVSNVSLNISVPIFNKLTKKNKISSSKIDYDIAQKTLANEILKSQIEDKLIVKEFNNSREALGAAKENSQISKENADLQFMKFEQGVIGLDNYLDSFNDYLKSELVYLNLLLDTYNYYSKILSRNL